MRSMLRVFTVTSAIIITGCGNLNSVYRGININEGRGALIDIKQRAILVKKDRTGFKVCAEPSPDALSAYASDLAAKVDSPERLSAAMGLTTSETSQYVGFRSQTIQLLRDGYFRTCESYMNGAINEEEYQWMLRRYQKFTVALLGIEQLTGAIVAAQSVPVSAEIVHLPTANTQQPPGDAASSPKPASTNPTPLGTPIVQPAVLQLISTPPKPVRGTAKKAPDTSPAPKEVSTVPTLPATNPNLAAVADSVKDIVIEILRADDEGQRCISYLTGKNHTEQMDAICKEYLKRLNDVYIEHLKNSTKTSPIPPAYKESFYFPRKMP